MQVISHDCFQLRNYLAIELACVVKRTAEQSDLKQQFKWYEGGRQINDLWAAVAQVFANQIEIASETTIGSSQEPIDTPVLEGPEDPARQCRDRKQIQDLSIVNSTLCVFVAPLRLCANIFINVWKVTTKREPIAVILLLRIVEIRKRCVGP